MSYNSKKQQGFTLIELIVVISIITFSLGVAIANYSTFNDRRQVETTVTSIKDFLHIAQRRAQAGDSPPECTSADLTPLQAYRVYEITGGLRMEANCGVQEPGFQVPTAGYGEALDLELPSGIEIGPDTDLDIRYWVLYGGADIRGDTTITVSKGTLQYQFAIEPGGVVTTGDWL